MENPPNPDAAVWLGLLAVIALMVLFMAAILTFLIVQQRRLGLLEETLRGLACPGEGGKDPKVEPEIQPAEGINPIEKESENTGKDAIASEACRKVEVETSDSDVLRAKVKAAEAVAMSARVDSEASSNSKVLLDTPKGAELDEREPVAEGKVKPSKSRPSVQTREGLLNRLASAQTLLRSLEIEESPLELNRKLAYLQAEVSSMRGADALELPAAELNEVLQFQSHLKEFIGQRHVVGKSEADPSGFALSEVRRLEKVVKEIAGCVAENLAVGRVPGSAESLPGIRFNEGDEDVGVGAKFDIGFEPEVNRLEQVVQEIEGFVGAQLQIGRELLTGESAGLTRDRLEQTLTSADDAFRNLVERQHQLAAGFLNHDLTLVDGQVDISPDLIGFCRHRCPDSALLQPQRPALCQFANGEGVYHAEVVTHLETVRAGCRGLIAKHAEQESLVQEARQLADAGRHDEAEKLLDRLDAAFDDLPTAELREQIESWRKRLTDLEERYRLLKKLLETPWEKPFAQPWKVIRREEELLAHAQDFEERLEAFRVELNESNNEEFVAAGVVLFNRLSDQLNELANTFTAQSNDAKISTFLHFVLIVESLAGWLFAYEESRPVIYWTLAALGSAFLVRRMDRWLLARTTVEFGLETNGKLLEGHDIATVFLNNKPYASGDPIVPGSYQLTLDSKIFEPLTQRVRIRYGRRNRIGSIPVRLSRDTYVNSLEMKFVPVAGTTVMISVWLTRVRDYRLFTRERALRWKRPPFKQDDLHPAVNVSWEDARSFCSWLTERERKMGRIGHRDEYRLPTDLEWSAACNVGTEIGNTPELRGKGNLDHYPWGPKWPPSRNSGNLDPSLKSDPYDYTSKVGMFPPNRHGLFDLAGNVWEWCEDLFDGKGKNRTLRGGSWHTASQEMLRSSFRLGDSPGHRVDIVGFRCVLEARKPSPLFRPEFEPQL